eukprot:2264882-Lingulodinium_polyedra.AAC.1
MEVNCGLGGWQSGCVGQACNITSRMLPRASAPVPVVLGEGKQRSARRTASSSVQGGTTVGQTVACAQSTYSLRSVNVTVN